ncbi:glycosyltransferase [Pseudoclavibacter soli]|uniref:glycosyltransferase n=1 Tax=Pseudoclavibacter soli TaxID=452623 RepID=UPI0003FB51C1|nr:glycosyltransferase [Pseudoclavibacter soli]
MRTLYDLAVVLTVHAEGRLIFPTVNALQRAVAEARANGLTTQVIIVQDRADEATKEAVQSALHEGLLGAAAEVRAVDVSHGDLGLARNSGVAQTSASYVGVLDADNLPSKNWLIAASEVLRSATEPAIVHPATIVTYGSKRECWPLQESTSAGFHAALLAWANPWDAFCLAPREVFDRFPYPECRPEVGFGPEDWAWNCTTVGAGVPHLVAAETALFYWAKDSASLSAAHGDSLLPQRTLLTSKSLAARESTRITELLSSSTAPVPRTASERLRGFVGRLQASSRVADIGVRGTKYLVRPVIDRLRRRLSKDDGAGLGAAASVRSVPVEYWREAHELQPLIPYPSEETLRSYGVWGENWDDFMLPDRRAYWQMISALPSQLDLLFVVPWIGTGGADLLTLQYVQAARRLRPRASIAVVTTEPAESTRLKDLPADVSVYELGSDRLHPPFATRALAQVVAQLRPGAVHVINSTVGFDMVDKFGRQLARHTRLYLSTYVVDTLPNGARWSFLDNRSRDFYTHVQRVLTDNHAFVQRAVQETGAPSQAFTVQHQYVHGSAHPVMPGEFSNERPLHLLWSGRFDRQKRLDRLADIFEECQRLGLPVTLDVFGEPVLDDDAARVKSCERLTAAGAVIHPPYQGDLRAVGPERFDALLLTSDWEGVPNTMLEGMANGLAVIAPAVGGIPEVLTESCGYPVCVRDVTDRDQITENFVEVIESLIGAPADAEERALAGRRKVAEEFSLRRFDEVLESLPGYLPSEAGSVRQPQEYAYFADHQTAELLRSEKPVVLLYTGSNGHSNFGDILQNKNILHYWEKRDDATPVLVLPAFSGAAGRFADLQKWYTPHILFFSEQAEAVTAGHGFRSSSSPQAPEEVVSDWRGGRGLPLLHVVGGGYINKMWGKAHLSAIRGISTDWRVQQVIMSGLQVDPQGAAGLAELVTAGLPASHIGFRDQRSLGYAEGAGIGNLSHFTFDDLTELLQDWAGCATPLEPLRRESTKYAVHMNSSDYAGGEDAIRRWADLLKRLSSERPEEVILLHAYADERPEVKDTLDTAAALAERFPFIRFRVISTARLALELEVGHGLPAELLELEGVTAGFSSSYHTALMMRFLGIPAYLVNANEYFAQKATLFQLPDLDTFLQEPGAYALNLDSEIASRSAWLQLLDSISPAVQR